MIVVRNLTKRFGERTAVDDLSFEVSAGKLTGFLGPNGAGKSTTLRMIMGQDRPSSGSATIDGRPYRSLEWPLREVGALLDVRCVHPGRSARAHLRMLARTNRITYSRVDEVLEMVGLSEVAEQRAGRFSLGMGQRLGIAVALLGDPSTLMFDEPVNGLDAEGIRWVRTLLTGLAREGRTVLVSSHLMSEMAQMADEVIVIGRGRLVAQLPVDEFLNAGGDQRVRVRSPQHEALALELVRAGARIDRHQDDVLELRGIRPERVGELAHRADAVIFELVALRPSLEEVFMHLTESALEYQGAPRAVKR